MWAVVAIVTSLKFSSILFAMISKLNGKLEILDVRERKQYLPTPAFGAFVLDH